MFEKLLQALKMPVPIKEYKFHSVRKWKFDYCWPDEMLALEVEGGAWTQGRHTRGKGFINDLEKYNTATAAGWRILRVTPDQLLKTNTIELIKKSLRKP
jgi:very-short-patch-repair endonuclease